MKHAKITPRLVVSDASAAIDFYTEVFDAEELERYAMPDGAIVHAAIRIDGAIVALAEDDPPHHNTGPAILGGSSVILTLLCDSPDAVADKAVRKGATIIFPVDDQFYGHREGRIRDPFGHQWILSKVVRQMSPEEIEAAMASLAGGGSS